MGIVKYVNAVRRRGPKPKGRRERTSWPAGDMAKIEIWLSSVYLRGNACSVGLFVANDTEIQASVPIDPGAGTA